MTKNQKEHHSQGAEVSVQSPAALTIQPTYEFRSLTSCYHQRGQTSMPDVMPAYFFNATGAAWAAYGHRLFFRATHTDPWANLSFFEPGWNTHRLYFPDATLGYAYATSFIGERLDTRLLKTMDGGHTWSLLLEQSGLQMEQVDYVGEQAYWAGTAWLLGARLPWVLETDRDDLLFRSALLAEAGDLSETYHAQEQIVGQHLTDKDLRYLLRSGTEWSVGEEGHWQHRSLWKPYTNLIWGAYNEQTKEWEALAEKPGQDLWLRSLDLGMDAPDGEGPGSLSYAAYNSRQAVALWSWKAPPGHRIRVSWRSQPPGVSRLLPEVLPDNSTLTKKESACAETYLLTTLYAAGEPSAPGQRELTGSVLWGCGKLFQSPQPLVAWPDLALAHCQEVPGQGFFLWGGKDLVLVQKQALTKSE